MHRFGTLANLLWGAGFVGHVALLVVLVIRGRVRAFPVFTAMLAYQVVNTLLLFAVSSRGSSHTYFVVYWSLAPADYLFQIALIFEMAGIVLRPTGTWVNDARITFFTWSIAGTMIAALVSIAIVLPKPIALDLWAARATVFTSLLTCFVFLAMSTAANRLGLLWRSHVMALGQGLTLWASTALFGNVMHLILGWRRNYVMFDCIEMIAYLGALGFWVVAFWKPERGRAPLSAAMQAYLLALHKRVRRDLEQATF